MVLICGILILVYQQSPFDVAMGVLLVSICFALGAGAALTIIGLRADRRLAALQIDFVSKVSHELKTPLTSIRMFVDTLRMGRVKDQEKIDHCLAVIDKETDRLSQLLGRLLSWGAMEAGAYKLSLARVAPATIVERALEMFDAQAQVAKADITVDVHDDLPDVEADREAMVDTLLNLLTNALRYGGEPKRVWVTARPSFGGVLITVRDNGIGIALQDQPLIFDRFYRADERYARAAGGTGLGLAIARHVVLAHNGSLDVDSRPGEGSEFTIRLPALDQEAASAPPSR